MTGYEYKITNRAGEFIIINDGSQSGAHTDPKNVYALQKFPTFVKSIKNTQIDRTGQVGIWDFYSFYGNMTITFSGIILSETHQKLEQMRAKMNRIFSLPAQPTKGNDGYVRIEWTDDDGIKKYVEAKIINDIQYDRELGEHNVISFLISLKTQTPYIFSGDGNGDPFFYTESGIRGYKKSGGIFLPTLVPIKWNSYYENVLEIDNTLSGIDSPTKIKIFGEAQQPITNPKIQSFTTGEVFEIEYTLASELDWIEIDAYNGTVKNQNGNDVSSYIKSGSSFITLKNGINEILYTSDQNPYNTLKLPTAIFEVKYLQTYDY
jgi:hypothetical protein